MSVDLSPRSYYSCRVSPGASTNGACDGTTPIRLLLADNDRATSAAYMTALTTAGYHVVRASSTGEAARLLGSEVFDVVVAEVGSVNVDGFELLRQVQAIQVDMPVVLTCSLADVGLARKALRLGAGDFVPKPIDGETLTVVVERNLTRQAMDRRRALRHRTQLEDTYETVLDALLCALDFRSGHTEEHTESVTACSVELARKLGVTNGEMYDLERGALLHDIGKIGVPDDVLHKPGPLTDAEWEEMRKHPEIGYRMCSRIGFLKSAAEIVLRHHEHWNGAGYPDGLAGKRIPLGARILAVVDAFHAITSDRPYRSAQPAEYAVSELRRCSGTQFDPDVVDAFLKVPLKRWMEIRSKTEESAS
jgi:putative nucleotidyltransferase with HDIG domain